MPVDQSTNLVIVQRSNRIMDATADLILRFGYRKVTIEDVAKRAAIGKGTIYLHWKSREALFHATLLRETLGVFRSLVDRMRIEPIVCLPHRLLSKMFTLNMAQPLLAALLTRDTAVLGKMVAPGSDIPYDAEETIARYREYFVLLREFGLLRTDLSVDQQLYLTRVCTGGAALMQPYLSTTLDIPARDKETVLAHTIRAALEPDGLPDPDALAAVAPRVIALFSDLYDRLIDAIHRGQVA